MKTIKFFYLAATFVLCGCGLNNKSNEEVKSSESSLTAGLEDKSEEYLSEDVNAINQALPEIMVLPSDNLLRKFNALKSSKGVERDYQAYLLANSDNKAVVSAIQEEFIKMDFPLNDLEQTIKQLSTRDATDEADGLAKDAKTLLMATASPDIIVEVDYKSEMNRNSFNRTLSYTLSFIDAYTNKVVSTKHSDGVDGKNLSDAFATSLKSHMPEIKKNLQKYFSGILTKGREISVRVTVSSSSNVNLADESIEGGLYSDWIDDYMDTHTVKGTFRLDTNTKNEMSFTNVRIKTLNDDGTQYSSYQWGREFAKAIRRELGVKVRNSSQGLGDVHLIITGM